MVTPAKTRPGTREERDVATLGATDTPWVTLVWDDEQTSREALVGAMARGGFRELPPA